MSAIQKATEQRDAAPAQPSPRQVVRTMLDTNRQGIAASLPRGFDADRFSRLLLTAANTNPALFDCDPTSFLAAGVAAAQLGLEPNDARGLAYLIPFSDRKRGKVVQLIIGYRGLMDLARRSGMVTAINAFPVFESDEFTYTLGLEPTLHHVPGDHDEDAAKLTHVYATARVMGDPQFVVMTRRQIEKVRLGSSGGRSDYSPWATHYTEMALKTAIRRLCKWLPQTVEVAQALAHEERPLTLADMAPGAVVAEYDRDDYIDVDTTTGELLPGAVTE